jgi:nicotinate phosphoribosyltransferase
VGTSLVTGAPDGALDGVYKLAESDGRPRMKISESLQKATLPGAKQVLRMIDEQGHFFGADAIVLKDEQHVNTIFHPFEPGKSLQVAGFRQEPLLRPVMENGRRLQACPSLNSIAQYSKERLALLPAEYKRFEYPHIYKTSISQQLMDLRNGMLNLPRF